MPRAIKKTNTITKSVENEVLNEDAVSTKDVLPDKKAVRKYTPEEAIPCESITSGELGMVGIKSNINYRWADRNDITDVEAQDLIAAIRSNSEYITKPYFIIRDEEFVEQHKQVKDIYENLYSYADLKDVLKLSASQMKSVIKTLPDGAKESVKSIAATMIQNGTLDSVNKIKILDELFDTKMMLMTDLYEA